VAGEHPVEGDDIEPTAQGQIQPLRAIEAGLRPKAPGGQARCDLSRHLYVVFDNENLNRIHRRILVDGMIDCVEGAIKLLDAALERALGW
jgi:hypothetical protein